MRGRVERSHEGNAIENMQEGRRDEGNGETGTDDGGNVGSVQVWEGRGRKK